MKIRLLHNPVNSLSQLRELMLLNVGKAAGSLGRGSMSINIKYHSEFLLEALLAKSSVYK